MGILSSEIYMHPAIIWLFPPKEFQKFPQAGHLRYFLWNWKKLTSKRPSILDITDSLIVNACLEIPHTTPHTHTHTHTLISMTPPFLVNCKKIITRTISEYTIFEYGNQLNRNDTDPSTREKREDYETVPESTGEVISLHKETKPIN